jgi:uncharacterized protein YjbI with pentapeptide repeats
LVIQCKFKDEDFVFQCDESTDLKSGLCVFHDENYLNDPEYKETNKQNVQRKLTEKIKNGISENKPLIFIKYHLPEFAFTREKITTPIDFSGTKFMGEVNFSHTEFTDVYFYDTLFTEEADFSGAQFKKEAHFGSQLATTSETIDVQFIKEFGSGAQFKKEAIFTDAQFARAVFSGVRFRDDADFSSTQFARANFSYAQFIDADFDDAKFTYANFSHAQFTDARFIDAQFTDVDFIHAQFTDADFSYAQFTDADFSEARFLRKADFSEVQYHRTSNYSKTEFMSGTEFSHSRFIQEATFINTIFGSRSKFNYVLFRDPENVIFQTNDLSWISFTNTDISRIRFGENVEWGPKVLTKQLFRWRFGDKNEFKILEERDIESLVSSKEVVQPNLLGSTLAVYRNLRENYEFRMRYDEAGEFFVREMEIKRRYREDAKNGGPQIRRNNLIIRNLSLTGLYYHLSKYGQSFSRPTIFGIGIILFSTLLWLTQPNPAIDFSIRDMAIPRIITFPDMDNKTNIEIALERGLTNFLPSLSFGTELNIGLLDVAFKIVGGAVTFGLIIIALRRKFERKFRH